MTTNELARTIGRLLNERRLTLAVAESCTGGLVSHLITEIPGSSAYFLGAAVTYAYQSKEQLLGVPHEMILGHGVVSEPVALAMARGIRAMLGSDVGLSITGIAGPGGATADKPVGLTYIGLAADGYQTCRRYVWQGDRSANKRSSATAALELLNDWLAG